MCGPILLALLAGGPPAARADGATGRVTLLVSYLDSAYTEEPWAVRLAVIAGHREAPNGSLSDMAAATVTIGLGKRTEARLFVPYIRSQLGDIYSSRGIGDSYLGLKLRVRDETRAGPALAFQPMLEVLGEESLFAGEAGPGKYNVALPIVAHKNAGHISVFGEAGYSTREVAFAGLGVYASLSRRWGACGTLLYSHATTDVRLNDEYGLGRRRADSGLSLLYAANADFTIMLSAMRTVSSMHANSTRYMAFVGAEYRVRLRRQRDAPAGDPAPRPGLMIETASGRRRIR